MATKPTPKTTASPSPDATRPDRKTRATGGARRGPKPAIEKEVSVASGREFLMGIDPTKSSNQSQYLFVNVDDIIRLKGGFKEYKQMRHDDAVKAAMSFKKILIYGRQYDFDPAGDDEKSKDIAEFCAWNCKRANLKSIMKEMLTAMEFGFSLGEILWESTTYKGKPCYAWKGLKFRDPEGICIHLDLHGNIVSVYQEAQMYGKRIDLPLDKIVHYAYQGEFGNVYGRSDYRSIYKNWWAKKFLINFWNVYLERLGSPTLLMKYPKGAGSALQATLKDILSDLGNRAEILVPAGVEVDVLESTRAGQATYNEALQYHDGAMAKGILVPALLGFGTKETRGADSQSQLQLKTLFKVCDEIGKECTDILQKQVIQKLVDFNYEVDEYPELIWQGYGEYQATDIADVIRLLHNAGILDMDQEDVNYVRSILSLPLRERRDDEDEVLRPLPAPQGTGANPPTDAAGQGNEKSKTGGSTGGSKQATGAKAKQPVRNNAEPPAGTVFASQTRKKVERSLTQALADLEASASHE